MTERVFAHFVYRRIRKRETKKQDNTEKCSQDFSQKALLYTQGALTGNVKTKKKKNEMQKKKQI